MLQVKPALASPESLLQRDVSMSIHVDFGHRTDEEKNYDADPINFSTAHPEAAYRIRMKRKAMEEAALGEAYHKAAGLHIRPACNGSLKRFDMPSSLPPI